MKKEGLKKYVELLVSEGYGFFTEIPKQFPELNLEWDYPGAITNIILDFDQNANYLNEKIISDIIEQECHAFQLRFFKPIQFEKILKVVSMLNANSKVENI